MVWFTMSNGEQPLFDDGYEAHYEAALHADTTGKPVALFDVYNEKAPYCVISPGERRKHAEAYAKYLRDGADDYERDARRALSIRDWMLQTATELRAKADAIMPVSA